MTTHLTRFFHDSETSFGVFYPKDYLICTFPSLEQTARAALAFRKLGLNDDDLLTLPGWELLEYFAEFREQSGLWSGLMKVISRAFATEQSFADDDALKANHGAGFLAVRCASAQDAARYRELLLPCEPLSMHRYTAGGVQSLI